MKTSDEFKRRMSEIEEQIKVKNMQNQSLSQKFTNLESRLVEKTF